MSIRNCVKCLVRKYNHLVNRIGVYVDTSAARQHNDEDHRAQISQEGRQLKHTALPWDRPLQHAPSMHARTLCMFPCRAPWTNSDLLSCAPPSFPVGSVSHTATAGSGPLINPADIRMFRTRTLFLEEYEPPSKTTVFTFLGGCDCQLKSGARESNKLEMACLYRLLGQRRFGCLHEKHATVPFSDCHPSIRFGHRGNPLLSAADRFVFPGCGVCRPARQ